MGRNENCPCFNHLGAAAHLKFLVNLIFQPDLKLKAAVETCLLLHGTQGWHTAETRNSLHLPPPTLQLKAFTNPDEYTASVWWGCLLSAVQSGRVTHSTSALPSPSPCWFNFHYLMHHTACYSHAMGSHGTLAIVSIPISFSVGGSMGTTNRESFAFYSQGIREYRKAAPPVAIATTPLVTPCG